MLAETRRQKYSLVVTWLKCRLSFSLLRWAVTAIRGSRTVGFNCWSTQQIELAAVECRIPSDWHFNSLFVTIHYILQQDKCMNNFITLVHVVWVYNSVCKNSRDRWIVYTKWDIKCLHSTAPSMHISWTAVGQALPTMDLCIYTQHTELFSLHHSILWSAMQQHFHLGISCLLVMSQIGLMHILFLALIVCGSTAWSLIKGNVYCYVHIPL